MRWPRSFLVGVLRKLFVSDRRTARREDVWAGLGLADCRAALHVLYYTSWLHRMEYGVVRLDRYHVGRMYLFFNRPDLGDLAYAWLVME